ncbi:MAG: U-box domain-containing protein [Bacteroidota bacterium]
MKSLLRTNAYVKKVKENLECPISYDIMTEAVITPYGRSYQEKAIKKWVRKYHNDPLTRYSLDVSDLKPNYDLRRMVEEYIATYGNEE